MSANQREPVAPADPMWTPSPERIEKANLTAFIQTVRRRWQPDLEDYSALYRWSIEKPDLFWQAVWEFCEVIASRSWDEVVVDFDSSSGAGEKNNRVSEKPFYTTRWFKGA